MSIRSGRLAFSPMEGVPDGDTNLIKTFELFDAPAQHPQIVRRRLGMHRKSHQDGNSGKHLHKALADLFQNVLPQPGVREGQRISAVKVRAKSSPACW